MAHLTTHTCLVCNNYYDWKPEIAAFDSHSDNCMEDPDNYLDTIGNSCGVGKSFAEFRKAFMLFCKLLRVDSITGGDDGGDPGSELPCCGECHVNLMDLLKLQKIIEETEKQQLEVVKQLKQVVLSNQCDRKSRLADRWVPVRVRLINGLSMQESGEWNSDEMEFFNNDEEETPSNQFKDKPIDTNDNDDDMDTRSLTSVSPTINNSKIEARASTPNVDQKQSEFLKIDSPKAKPNLRVKGRKRKVMSQVPIGRKTRSMDKVDDKIRNNQGVPEESVTESHRGESSNPVIYENNVNPADDGSETKFLKQNKEGELFFLLSDNLLSYKGILIRFSPTEFICLEDDCGQRINGSDYFAFEEFRKHAKDCHNDLLTDSANVRQQKRSCPLCPQEFGSLRRFRRHTFGRHRPPTVCISCWKPLKSYNIMDNHVWFHKNDEEKSAAQNFGNERNRILHMKRRICNAKRSQKRLKPSQKEDLSSSKASLKASSSKASRIKQTRAVNEDIKMQTRNNYKESDLFFLLSDKYISYKGILIQMLPNELICQERGCGTRMLGLDYFAFEEFRNHVKTCHALLLEEGDSNFCGFEDQLRSCPLCNEQFQTLRRFRRHIFGRHSPPAICTSCQKPLMSYNWMNNHVWFHMNEEERARAEAEGYDRKRKSIIPKGSFQCTSCPKQFTTKIEVSKHEKTHIPVHLRPQFECQECGAKLLHRRSLRSHIERLHKPELIIRKRECYICLQQFNFEDGERYRNHMRSHTGESYKYCDICGKGFINNSTFKLHCETVHTTLRPYQCEFCSMNYKHRQALRRHQRDSHKGLVREGDPEARLKATKAQYPHLQPDFIGPKIAYPCKHCEKVFELRGRLNKHVKLSHCKK